MKSQEQITTDQIFSVLMEPDTKRGIKEILKLEADSLKCRTFEAIMSDDEEYDDRRQELVKARKEYNALQLTEEQKDVIDTMLAREDECNYDQISNAYLAGFLDGYRILKEFGLTRE